MKCVLLNVHNFHSNNKNKDYSVIQVLRDITGRERDQGYLGKTISQEVFLPDSLVGSVDNTHIGKDLDLVYEVYGNKAELVSIKIL